MSKLSPEQIADIKRLLDEEGELPRKWREVLFPELSGADDPDATETLETRTTGEKASFPWGAEERRRSETRYRALFDRVPSAVAVYEAVDDGRDFVFTDFNQAGCRIEHVEKQDVIGRRVTEVFPGVAEFGLLDVFRKVYRTGEPAEHPLRFYQDDRIVGWRENYIYKLPTDEVVAVYDDVTERKRSEAALSASESRFHALFTTMQEGVCLHEVVYDIDGDPVDYRILDVNPAYEKFTGTRRRDVVGGLASVVYGTGEPPYFDLYEKVARSGEPASFETYFPPMDRHFFVSVFSPERDHFATVFFDISAAKRAEQAMRRSEEKYRNLSEEISDGVAVTLRDKNHWVNKAFAEIFGYDKEELVGKGVDFLVVPEEVPVLLERMGHRLAGEDVPPRYEIRARHKDGRILVVDVAAKVIRFEGEDAIQLVVRDITEQKRAAEALQESEAKYRTLVEMFPHAIVIIQDGSFTFVNDATLELFGVETAQALVGQPVLHFVVEEDRDRIAGYMRARIGGSDDAPTHYEVKLSRASGEVAHAEVFVEVVSYQGRPAIQAMAMDVTERKRSEEERRNLEVQMMQAQKLESLGVLAGGIAHDFNNLLMGILGYADLALMEVSPTSPAIQSLKEIEKASRQAAELCKQMLAYSGKGRFVTERLHLQHIVEDMAHLLKVSISKQTVLKFDFAPGLPTIEADPSQIRQVVMNLIVNASEALEGKSGIISLVTGVMECDRDYLTETFLANEIAEGIYVYLEVSDSGCGMDAETREKIFDPFFSTKFTGRGLGLAAVLGIMRGHHGAIKVYTEPGRGTTFKVLFPAVTGQPTPMPTTGAASEQPWGKGFILVVDDEPSARTVTRLFLEKAGFRVLLANDGEEALEMFRAQADNIVAVILDLTMPKMGGEDTFRELRRIRADVKVLLSSGYNEMEVTQRFVGKGLAGFIQKPYKFSALMEKLKEIL